jgi:hypothetical protein
MECAKKRADAAAAEAPDQRVAQSYENKIRDVLRQWSMASPCMLGAGFPRFACTFGDEGEDPVGPFGHLNVQPAAPAPGLDEGGLNAAG